MIRELEFLFVCFEIFLNLSIIIDFRKFLDENFFLHKKKHEEKETHLSDLFQVSLPEKGIINSFSKEKTLIFLNLSADLYNKKKFITGVINKGFSTDLAQMV